jgi:hypothetical protein
MELASMLAGERFSDRPASVCPIIGALLRAHNDTLDDERRSDLYRYAAEAVGTRGDFSLQLTRAAAAITWARRRYLRSRTGGLRGRFRRLPDEPAPDHGPERISRYVIGSLGHDGHQLLLALLDRLIELGYEDAPAELDALELFEQAGEPVEDCRGSEQFVVAELV